MGSSTYWDSDSEEQETDSQSEDTVSTSEDNESYVTSNSEDSESYETYEELQSKIYLTLKQLRTPNAFACSSTDDSLPNPGLYIAPYGVLGLPLSTDDAKKIIAQASQSPFGKGEETLIDTTVRKSWELQPNQFSFKNPGWEKSMETILNSVCNGLGINRGIGNITAELHKLLLYEPGAFFKSHTDSEKSPGMFATLVVCLPSPHEGGKLVLTHHEEKYEFKTDASSKFSFSYAAWYSDITHEVLPVKAGYRLMLTFNLIRGTNLGIPSYDLVRKHVKRLSALLERYNSRVEEGYDVLPHILVHKLKHKYSQANLNFNSLKPQDLAQVSTLAQVSRELGFEIYLATLELVVKKQHDDYRYTEKAQSLENMVELNGQLVEKSFQCPEGALIHPEPQDAREPEKETRYKWSGNYDIPATSWYRDSVVVLVPPSAYEYFIFHCGSGGRVIDPLFCRLAQELSENPTDKLRLELLCERALKKNPEGESRHDHELKFSIPPYFQKAVTMAFDLGRIDLFDIACERTNNRIILDNAQMLGRWTARVGVATMKDRLMKGVKKSYSIEEKVEFLKTVAEGFEGAVQESTSVESVSLKRWIAETILSALTALKELTKADAICLGKLVKSMDWTLFKSKSTPVLLKAGTMIKIAFLNELMANLPEIGPEQRSFAETLIHIIWLEFFNKNDFNAEDIRHIIETTILILPSKRLEAFIIPALLAAIPSAALNSVKTLFIPVTRMILKNELVGFRLATNETIPPPSHKRLTQAFLTKFLLDTVRRKPSPPKNLSLRPSSCSCKDCTVVNNFLVNPAHLTLKFPCSKRRRLHLYAIFTRSSSDRDCSTPNYDVKTVRGFTTYVWQISKDTQGYQLDRAAWVQETDAAKKILLELKNDEPVAGRLEAYLQPYYSKIMNAMVEELPDLNNLVTVPKVSENSENTAPNHPTNQNDQKRGASEIDLPEDEHAKRTKQETAPPRV